MVTKCWLTSLWKGITHFRIKVTWRHFPQLPLQRVGDCYLNVLFSRLDYDREQMRALNRYRLYLGVYSLADIVTGNGYRIWKDFIHGRQPRDVQASPYQWPMEKPTQSDKNLWIAALAAISSPSFNLQQRLGQWTTPPH